MNIPRLFYAITSLSLVGPASANIFSGTMTCTVTSSMDSMMTVGTVFQNTFYYESDTIDGTFSVNNFPDHTQPVVDGKLLVSSSSLTEHFYGYWPIATPGVNGVDPHGYMTVSNGVVTGFLWDNESGNSTTYYSDYAFGFFPFNPDSFTYNPQTSPVRPPDTLPVFGTTEFSAVQERVPDEGSILFPLVFALGVMAWRRSSQS